MKMFSVAHGNTISREAVYRPQIPVKDGEL